MKVIEFVLETHAYGWSPDGLQFQHPYLTLGQIHSARAYIRKGSTVTSSAARGRPSRYAAKSAPPDSRSAHCQGAAPVVPLTLYMEMHVLRAVTNGLRRRGL